MFGYNDGLSAYAVCSAIKVKFALLHSNKGTALLKFRMWRKRRKAGTDYYNMNRRVANSIYQRWGTVMAFAKSVIENKLQPKNAGVY